MSLAFPGLGQLYNTQYRRAAGMFATALAIHLLFTAVWCFTPPANFGWVAFGFLMLAGVVGIRVVAMLDAAWQARRMGAVQLGDLNRGSIYVIFLLASWITGFFIEEFRRDHPMWSVYSINGGSMAPTVPTGDKVVAWAGYYRDHRPARGDVVFLEPPGSPGRIFIGRVIGLPEDRLQLTDGVLYVNDVRVARESVADSAALNAAAGLEFVEVLPDNVRHHVLDTQTNDRNFNTGVFAVPAGRYFVLGDNRAATIVSRALQSAGSYVPGENLRDRAMFIYWSTPFGRIGSPVQPTP